MPFERVQVALHGGLCTNTLENGATCTFFDVIVHYAIPNNIEKLLTIEVII